MASETLQNTRFVSLIVSVATLGGFLFGFDSGVISGTVDGLQQAFGSTSIGTGFSVGLPATYAFYAAAALISAWFVAKLVQETAGRELEVMTG